MFPMVGYIYAHTERRLQLRHLHPCYALKRIFYSNKSNNNNLATLFSGGTYTGNIDNINQTSFVWVNFTTVTGALPKTTGFGIICTYKIVAGMLLQVAFNFHGNISTPYIYYRIYANSQWYKWASFTGTLLDA